MTMIASMALDHALHATGLKALSSELSGLSIINEAGEFLVSMHAWDWLVRSAATLDLVGAQSYAELPAEFAEMVAFDASNSLVNSLHMTSHRQLLSMKTNAIQTVSGNYWGAISWPEGTDGIPAPRLELWPTPAADEAGALSIIYRAGWTEITDDADTIRMPSWMHGLFLSIVRAIALGYEDQDAASKALRLAEIKAGPEFDAAKERDCAAQTHYGKIAGGAAMHQGNVRSWDYPVADPS